MMKGIREGAVTITAKTVNGKEATAAVHVTKTEEPEKTTIRLDSESGKICVGETVTVVAIVTPEGTPVEWSSSDKTVATVEDGVITGVGEGSIKITARADTAQAVHRIRRKQPF